MGWDFYTHSSAMLLIRIREMVSLLCRKMYLTTFWKAKSISARVRWTRSRIEDIMNKTFFLVVRVVFLGLHLFVEELLWFWLKRLYVWFAWLPPRYAVAFILNWSERRSQRLSMRGKERMSRRQQRVTHGYRRFLCVGHTQSRVGR